MSHPHSGSTSKLSAAFREASHNRFFPLTTIRCSEHAVFLTQAARDLGCLLDVDDSVVAWSCLPREFDTVEGPWIPDFLVDYDDGRAIYLDAAAWSEDAWVSEAIACQHERHRFVTKEEIHVGHRLQNARDLLRYGNRRTPLNDRVRFLAGLDEAGSLSVAECLGLFHEVQPMTGLAWLTLHRFVSMELDEGPIGPETVVRRFQR